MPVAEEAGCSEYGRRRCTVCVLIGSTRTCCVWWYVYHVATKQVRVWVSVDAACNREREAVAKQIHVTGR